MNTELLNELGLNPEKGIKEIVNDLEDLQFDYLQRLETANDENRKKELSLLVEKIGKEVNDLKIEMSEISSSIIFDFEGVGEEGKTDKKQKKSKTVSKAEEIKAKGAERKKKKEEQRQTATENVTPTGDDSANNTQQPISELMQAFTYYHHYNFQDAFDLFKKLSEEGDSKAQYMLGNMYDRGEGADMSPERAEFWLKKSADADDEDGQLSYAKFKIYQSQFDNTQMPIAIQYLTLAADKGNEEAMALYVELAQKGIGNAAMNKKAAEYCDKLVEVATDSFDKQAYEDIRKDYKKAFKKSKDEKSRADLASKLMLIGSAVIVLATMMLYTFEVKAFDSDLLATSLWIVIPLGYILTTVGDIPEISGPAYYLSKVASIAPFVGLVLAVFHADEAGMTKFGIFLNFAASWLVCFLIGKAIGLVISKIWEIKSNKNK